MYSNCVDQAIVKFAGGGPKEGRLLQDGQKNIGRLYEEIGPVLITQCDPIFPSVGSNCMP